MGANSDPIKGKSPYLLFAISMIIVAIIAFTPRYFLPVLNNTVDIRPVLHVHGVTGCAWLILFTAQVMLISKQRYLIHKRLGVTSLLLAALLFVSGLIVALEVYWRTRADGFQPANPVLLVNLSDMVLFASLYIAGVFQRKRAKLHKSLMFLAALSLMNAAIFRVISYIIGGGGAPVFGSHIIMICLYSFFLFWLNKRYGQIPRFIKIVGLALIVITAIRIPIGFSPIWVPVGDWIFALRA